MKQIERNDLLTYKFLSNLNSSPTEGTLSFVVTNSNEEDNCYNSNIWTYQPKSNSYTKLTAQEKESSHLWDTEDTIIFPATRSASDQKRKKAKEIFTTYYRISIKGGEATKAFEVPLQVKDIEKVSDGLYVIAANVNVHYPDYHTMSKEEKEKVVKALEEDADYEVIDEIPFWANGGSFTHKTRTGLFLFEEKTGTCTRLTPPTFDLACYEIFGSQIYYAGDCYDKKPSLTVNLYSYDLNTKETKTIDDTHSYCYFDLITLNDQLILIATNMQEYGLNENPCFYQLNPKTNEISLLAKHDDSLGSSVGCDCRYGGSKSWIVYQDKLYFITTRRNASHLYCLDQNGTIQPVLTKEGSVDGFAFSSNSLYIIGMYDQKLQELYQISFDDVLANTNAEKLQQISNYNTEVLQDKYIAIPEKINIAGSTTDIDGWVLKPYGFDPEDKEKKYPAILEIHGGPKTVYGEVFHHEMQYLASQGHFVFFCNPEGSDGRGNAFADIRGKYGTIDYDTIMKFTDAVLEKYPEIDTSRVAVTGGSYGGFMTNWIIGHTDRFVCAATQRSISNWISMYGISDIGPYFTKDQMAADIYDNTEKLWWHSPIKYVAQMKTPTLFIHSNEDYRCPMAEGMQLYTALVNKGVPAKLCYFKGENHELSRSGKPLHRLRRLKELIEWIQAYTMV